METDGGAKYHDAGFAGLPYENQPVTVTLLGNQLHLSSGRHAEVSNLANNSFVESPFRVEGFLFSK